MALQKRVRFERTKPIKYGRKIVRLSIGPRSDTFVVHEDLLCFNSPLFRQELQRLRQVVEGDCPICHERMDPGIRELTFCQSCGGNFHFDCISQWEEQGTNKQHSECPLCRQYLEIDETEQSETFTYLNPRAFEIYSEWIYKGYIGYTDQEVANDMFHDLILAYIFASIVQDFKFRNATIKALVEISVSRDMLPHKEDIIDVYKETPVRSRLRRLMVELYISIRTEDFDESAYWEGLPPQFTRDLAMALREKFDYSEEDWDIKKIIAKLGMKST